MKLALACAPVKNRDIAFNLKMMQTVIRNCQGKVDLIVFGETVLQGFNCLCWDYETDKNMAVSLKDMPVIEMQHAAEKYGIAVSFGFIERDGESLHDSYISMDDKGKIINHYRRISRGWKEYTRLDHHYQEGSSFSSFTYNGEKTAVGLCGDLWEEGRAEEMKSLHADLVLWPVWCDYNAGEWNRHIKYEYADQAGLCGANVVLVNPYDMDRTEREHAAGGCAWIKNGVIREELAAGSPGILAVEI